MIRNLLNAEKIIYVQYKNFQNVKPFSSLCKNSSTGILIPKSCCPPLYFNLCEKKNLSSDATSTPANNAVHKVFFVSADSSEVSDPISEPVTADYSEVSEPVTASTSAVENAFDTSGLSYIPPPPSPEIIHYPLNALGEATFKSVGLGGWSPVGLVQSSLEFLHVSLNIPWWGTILAATVVIRMALSPIVIKSQRNSIKMAMTMPVVTKMQERMSEARTSGNTLEASRIAYEMQKYMKENDVNPLKSMLLPLCQAPIFISMFLGLKGCAQLPVESFTTGGMYWFTDLTVYDPYYILPLITSATLFVSIRVGAETGVMAGKHGKMMMYVMNAIPVVMFPFVMHFPSAVLCYWVSTNFCTLAQVSILRIPKVRNYFGIMRLQKPPVTSTGSKGLKGMIKDAKKSYSNMKVTSQLNDRQRIDEIAFQKAGKGPIIRTYKSNPLEKKKIIDVKPVNKK